MKEITPVMLAAGCGKRLGVDVPKPMVLVEGRPMMQGAVEALFKMGFRPSEIKAVIGYKGEIIKDHFGGDLGYYSQEKLNGNAGAVDLVVANLREVDQVTHILAIQGDDADQATVDNLQGLIHFHLKRSADISILTVNKPDTGAHLIEYVYGPEGRVFDMVPLNSVDSHGSYTAGIFLFSREFLDDFLPLLKGKTPKGEELGIAGLISLAIEEERRVFQLNSSRDYVSVNTPEGLEHLRQKGD